MATPSRWPRWALPVAATLACATLAIVVWWVPVASTLTRALLIVGSLGCWIGVGGLAWNSKRGRAAWAVFTGCVVVVFSWPSPPAADAALRDAYVAHLRAYVGTPYVWGGENSRGIDCSGLVRRAFIDAHLACALRGPSPWHLRRACSLWWNDESAKALGAADRSTTRLVRSAASINDLDVRPLRLGDLAVTQDGVHVLAYVGGDEWISADPDRRRVVTDVTPAEGPWFQVPVRVTIP